MKRKCRVIGIVIVKIYYVLSVSGESAYGIRWLQEQNNNLSCITEETSQEEARTRIDQQPDLVRLIRQLMHKINAH